LRIGLAVALAAARAGAQDDPGESDLHKPQRLTVGVADDLLGQLSADGKTLYFVSNRDTTNQVFAQTLADGRARPFFDEGADVTWPRVSPDGKRLLYISFREHASGQLCVRDLPDGGGRRCLDDPSAALQAEWIDANRVALVGRQSIRGDLTVLDVTVNPSFSAHKLVDRNITSPALSPDGRWMVYVPVARTVDEVGPAFAAHAAPRLEAVRLGSAGTPLPVPLLIPLPGQTGQPVFARDGRSLYVVQFFADTNQDGTVDASDHGVLFRVPISLAGEAPVLGEPEQLTEASWNCEYPAPFADRLIVTCSQDAGLDVYSLPLEGEVPPDLGAEELAALVESAGSRVEQQLIASRRLARETSPSGRRRAMLALALLHLQREEYLAAAFYAEQIATLHDPETKGIGRPLKVLVEQRKAERRREQGRLTEGFRAQSRQRLDELQPATGASPMGEVLRHVVRSEISDATGDKKQARLELEAVTLDASIPAPIAQAYYERADALFRELDDPDALVAACRQLSASGGLSPDEQLRYARAAARAMIRGLPHADADAVLVRERARITGAEPELAFAVDLARAVLAIRDAQPPGATIDALLALYAAQTRPGRRRALMADAVQHADQVHANAVVEALAQRDITDVKRGTRERRVAERLFRRVMTGRAYERAAAHRYEEARADFDAVADQTGSLEAVTAAIDMRLKKGEPPAEIDAYYGRGGRAPSFVRFAKAYLIARQLPKLEGEAHAKAAASAIAALNASRSELADQRIAQALFGALLHEQYVETGDLATAERANVHYLIALELMGKSPRFRAMILGELGILQDDVGNYRIALSYLLERDKLPYADNAEGLDVLLSKSQALLHVGREAEAADAADAAIAMIDRNPGLSKYRLLALDCAALYSLAAGRFARSLALYGEEIPLVDALPGAASARNRIVTRLARAAAAVGAGEPARALLDLDQVDASLRDPKVPEVLLWPHSTAPHVLRAYRVIAAGLRAHADQLLGRLDAEASAIDLRRGLLEERLDETGRGEVVRQQMLADAQLALNANQRHDVAATRTWLGRALANADDLRGRAQGVSDRAQLDVLWMAAELTVSTGARLVDDLPQRLASASTELAKRHDPALRSYQRWFEIYEPLVGPGAALAREAPPGQTDAAGPVSKREP
jgi:hypothetical protein